MLAWKFYDEKHFSSLNDYQLSDEQARFTSTIDYCVNTRKDILDELKDIVTIVYKDIPIGFFVLDRGKDKLLITENINAILIRSFSLNPEFQGKGFGALSMQLVTDFVQHHFTDINEIVLSVNCKNNHAYRTYIKAGFIDTNDLIYSKMGQQNILSKNIAIRNTATPKK